LQIQVIDPSGELIFTEKDFNVIKETNFLEEIKKNLGFYITLITLIILGIIFLTLKNKIKEIFEKIKSKRKIEKIIKSKVKNNEVSKEELKSGKIKEKKIVPEDQVF
jgi:Na+-translocating ferredoxin:NAD+ oxidoreductase RnfG subunit